MAPSGTTFSPSSTSTFHEPMTKIKTSDPANGPGTVKVTSVQAMALEHRYSAHNYHPLPVVFARALGAKVWDPEGREYLDFLSACTPPPSLRCKTNFEDSAVNQGHCHPKILKALVDQAGRLALSSRAFYNDMYGQYAKFVTEYFGYDMVLPMYLSRLNVIDYRNTGAEAVETGIKLARRWGYLKKGIPVGQAIVFSAEGNFHGRTTGVVSMSTDPESRDYHGPFLPLVGATVPSTGKTIRYNNIQDLEEAFERHGENVAAFLVEPIQGEAGYILPGIPLTIELLSQMTNTFLKFANYARNTTSSLSQMKFKLELQEQGKCYAWTIGTSNPMSFSSERQSQEESIPSAQSSQVEI